MVPPRPKIPFGKPYFTPAQVDEILARMRKILESGWLTSGPYVQELERLFGEAVGARAVAMNSCTACLHSILLVSGIGPGDEVIVPTNTYVSTPNSVLYVGGEVVFADCLEDTFNIDPSDVESKVTKRTKAIIPVHMAGNPCDMDRLLKIADESEILLIEDCAHAIGSYHRGKHCGTMGVAGAFSLYPTKLITTAEGGPSAASIIPKCPIQGMYSGWTRRGRLHRFRFQLQDDRHPRGNRPVADA